MTPQHLIRTYKYVYFRQDVHKTEAKTSKLLKR